MHPDFWLVAPPSLLSALAIVEVRSQIPEFDCVNPSILDG